MRCCRGFFESYSWNVHHSGYYLFPQNIQPNGSSKRLEFMTRSVEWPHKAYWWRVWGRRHFSSVLLYVHRNRRLIRDGSPGRPPRLSHSSWTLKEAFPQAPGQFISVRLWDNFWLTGELRAYNVEFCVRSAHSGSAFLGLCLRRQKTAGLLFYYVHPCHSVLSCGAILSTVNRRSNDQFANCGAVAERRHSPLKRSAGTVDSFPGVMWRELIIRSVFV